LRRGEERIDLVIDAAGKIRSTKFVGETEDKELMAATAGWKFIPAFKGDHAVACRLLFEVQNRK
jgi:hypothetical protein